MLFSRDLSDPGIELGSPALHADTFYCLSHCTQAETETSLHPKPDHDSGHDTHLDMDSLGWHY